MNWPKVNLGEVASVHSGVGFPKRYQGRSEGEFPFAKVGDISKAKRTEGATISTAENYVSGEVLGELRAKLFPARSIVFAKIGEAIRKNNRCITTKKMAFDNNVMGIKFKEELVSTDFAFHFLNSIDFYQLSNSTTVPSIRKTDMEMLEIPLPPLAEQRRIAGILDQADELRRLRSSALDKLKTLGQAIFHEMFGDVRSDIVANTLLGDCADFYSGNTLPDGEDYHSQEGGYLILKVSDLNRPANAIEIHEAAAWSDVPGSKAATCPAGAIVFPKRGGAIGTNKKRILRRPAVLDPNLMGVLPRFDRMNTDFLSGWFSLFTLSDIASGSSVPQLNKKDLAPLRLRVPELRLQARFGERRKQLESLWLKTESDLEGVEKLFASLQQRAFSGDL